MSPAMVIKVPRVPGRRGEGWGWSPPPLAEWKWRISATKALEVAVATHEPFKIDDVVALADEAPPGVDARKFIGSSLGRYAREAKAIFLGDGTWRGVVPGSVVAPSARRCTQCGEKKVHPQSVLGTCKKCSRMRAAAFKSVQAREARPERTCTVCGTKVKRRPSDFIEGKAVACSRACSLKLAQDGWKKAADGYWETRPCSHCGTGVRRKPYVFAKRAPGENIVCSPACRKALRGGPRWMTLTCEECKATFVRRWRSDRVQKFCGRECAARHRAKVAELADVRVSNTRGETREGSSPSLRTNGEGK